MDAADRFTDTSWHIHKQWQSDASTAFPTTKTSPTNKQNGTMMAKNSILKNHNNNNNNNNSHTVKTNGFIPNSIMKSPRGESTPSPKFNSADKYEPKKVVQIETVQTTLETVASPPPPVQIKTTAVLHAHEESTVGLTKTTSSTRINNSYGEALTSQPRSTKNAGPIGGMDLIYVTERIIALWFPSSNTEQTYRQGQRHAAHMLNNKHGDNYMVFNLSEPKRALRNEHKHVKEVGWPSNLAPPLERLCNICKEIESWLAISQHKIAVLHVCGNKDKLGVVVAAYVHYSSICGTADQALDRFSMRRFLEDNVGPLQLPSNKRYVDYFAGLLSHDIKVNAAPLYLTHVTVLGAPSFQQGGCRAFLKLYEGLTPVYTSGVYSVVSGVKQFTVNIAAERRPGLQLRGDIMLKCYHRGPKERETIFACQFHTCAVADYTLSFTRQELDGACNDSRFPPDGAVELHFSAGPEGRFSAPAPTPAVPVTLADDPVTRADSPLQVEEYEEDDSDGENGSHTFGPLDGSIYATIAKKPELSPGAVSSPLTVSMDSGISSAGHQQNANTNASTSPPLTAQPSPLTPEDQHRELDELLTDMMLTVQSIPDVKPRQSSSASAAANFDIRYIDEEDDKNIPYHARQDSRPFSYGVNSDMISESKGLSSPSLVRKASFNKSSGDTLKKVQTQVFPDSFSPKSTYNSHYQKSYATTTTATPRRDPIDDIFTESALNANARQPYRREFREEFYKDEVKRYDPMKRSFTDGSIGRGPERIADYKTSVSFVSNPYTDSTSLSPPGQFRNPPRPVDFHDTYSSNNLTWLQKQQIKLKERRELQLREERQPHELRLISELRNVQSRHIRPSASHRADGYTSDTTAFADDDEDFTIPLHINTTPRNTGQITTSSRDSSMNYNSALKNTFAENDRPFVTIKRTHERYAQSSASPASTHPHDHLIRSPSRGGDITDAGLLSLVERERFLKQNVQQSNTALYREDSLSSWRTGSEMDSSPPHSISPRPQTPAFPVHPRTPYTNSSTPTVQFDLSSERLPPKSPTTLRKDIRPLSPSELINGQMDYTHSTLQRSMSATQPPSSNYNTYKENFENYSPKSSSMPNGSASPTISYGHSRRSSLHSESPQEVSPAHVKFVRDTSKYWYKATISREEAINILRSQPPGTFIVRDSNSFPGAFGLALKVATLPSNVQVKSPGSDEYVRHFLIEPTSRGVRLKGCTNEPVFSSLSALIYQHSITQMALPCRLVLPEADVKVSQNMASPAQAILSQGAACNVHYLFTLDMESLTGPHALKKTVHEIFQKSPLPQAASVHFKVNGQGITLTDHKRKLFFRKHYPINTISYCGLDPDEHRWNVPGDNSEFSNSSYKIFGFVARKPASTSDNQCHLFAELEPEQPAAAIVNFVNKVLNSSGIKANIV